MAIRAVLRISFRVAGKSNRPPNAAFVMATELDKFWVGHYDR